MSPNEDDLALRAAAITHVEALARRSPDGYLAWSEIELGFEHRGERVLLANRTRGIFWPRQLRAGALSIKTVVPRQGRRPRYDDAELGATTPWFAYRYQGEDPDARDNVRLRQCCRQELPILYFYGVSEARYLPLRCYVAGDEPRDLTFHVSPVPAASARREDELGELAPLGFERAYALATVRRRLHQGRFRAAVLDAYGERCAICHLRRGNLLDATHIIPDHEKLGEARVPNGLALCKLHHAAFDSDLLGVTPDLEVRLARGLLEERDGPMLEHGLRGFHGQRLRPPSEAAHAPDRDLVGERWERFLRAEAA